VSQECSTFPALATPAPIPASPATTATTTAPAATARTSSSITLAKPNALSTPLFTKMFAILASTPANHAFQPTVVSLAYPIWPTKLFSMILNAWSHVPLRLSLMFSRLPAEAAYILVKTAFPNRIVFHVRLAILMFQRGPALSVQI
jgi:hypothetical protein